MPDLCLTWGSVDNCSRWELPRWWAESVGKRSWSEGFFVGFDKTKLDIKGQDPFQQPRIGWFQLEDVILWSRTWSYCCLDRKGSLALCFTFSASDGQKLVKGLVDLLGLRFIESNPIQMLLKQDLRKLSWLIFLKQGLLKFYDVVLWSYRIPYAKLMQ